MNEKEELFKELVDRTDDYVKTHVELLKLYLVDKISEALSSVVAVVIILFVASLFLLLLNFGVAMWLGALMHSLYAGFLILALFYALVTLLLYLFRDKWIKRPIINKIIADILK